MNSCIRSHETEARGRHVVITCCRSSKLGIFLSFFFVSTPHAPAGTFDPLWRPRQLLHLGPSLRVRGELAQWNQPRLSFTTSTSPLFSPEDKVTRDRPWFHRLLFTTGLVPWTAPYTPSTFPNRKVGGWDPALTDLPKVISAYREFLFKDRGHC